MQTHIFEKVPQGFFNLLASGSGNDVNAGCLLEIYRQYDMEVSYRISRKQLRDALAIYISENNIHLSEEDDKNLDIANSILRKFSDDECGWLTEETDDATYEKYIVMTEAGIALAEFLISLEKPEKVEYSTYIYSIYNTLTHSEQWKSDPYVGAIKTVYNNAKALSKSLKRLSTFIRKLIEDLIRETSLETLTDNLLAYCNGDFIKEYARLTKQQNIHMYRSEIRQRLDAIISDSELHETIILGCAIEENLKEDEAENRVYDMVESTKQFLSDDYDRIMKDIKHKINVHIHVAIGRIRFIRNNGTDSRGNVEQILKHFKESLDECDMNEELPEEFQDLFRLDRNEYIDTGSIWYPRKNHVIKKATVTDVETISEDDLLEAKARMEAEAYNPYSKSRMKRFLNEMLGGRQQIESDEMPLGDKSALLSTISAVAYAEENGFEVELQDGFVESDDMYLRRFSVRRKSDGI